MLDGSASAQRSTCRSFLGIGGDELHRGSRSQCTHLRVSGQSKDSCATAHHLRRVLGSAEYVRGRCVRAEGPEDRVAGQRRIGSCRVRADAHALGGDVHQASGAAIACSDGGNRLRLRRGRDASHQLPSGAPCRGRPRQGDDRQLVRTGFGHEQALLIGGECQRGGLGAQSGSAADPDRAADGEGCEVEDDNLVGGGQCDIGARPGPVHGDALRVRQRGPHGDVLDQRAGCHVDDRHGPGCLIRDKAQGASGHGCGAERVAADRDKAHGVAGEVDDRRRIAEVEGDEQLLAVIRDGQFHRPVRR